MEGQDAAVSPRSLAGFTLGLFFPMVLGGEPQNCSPPAVLGSVPTTLGGEQGRGAWERCRCLGTAPAPVPTSSRDGWSGGTPVSPPPPTALGWGTHAVQELQGGGEWGAWGGGGGGWRGPRQLPAPTPPRQGHPIPQPRGDPVGGQGMDDTPLTQPKPPGKEPQCPPKTTPLRQQ